MSQWKAWVFKHEDICKNMSLRVHCSSVVRGDNMLSQDVQQLERTCDTTGSYWVYVMREKEFKCFFYLSANKATTKDTDSTAAQTRYSPSIGILLKAWHILDGSSINNCYPTGLMGEKAFFPHIIIYSTRQIPLNICDQPWIPVRNISATPVRQFIISSIVCMLNPCSQQPWVFSAVHQRGCFPHWDKKLNLQEQRMLGLLQGGEAAALIMEPTPIAQAMRQTAVAPAQPWPCVRMANSVTSPLFLSPVCVWTCGLICMWQRGEERKRCRVSAFLRVLIWVKICRRKRDKSGKNQGICPCVQCSENEHPLVSQTHRL